MSIKDDFEKVFEEQYGPILRNNTLQAMKDSSRWAARWMAERCARLIIQLPIKKNFLGANEYTREDVAKLIDQLAKELDA